MGWTEAVEAAGSLGVTPEMTPRFLVAVLVAILALRVEFKKEAIAAVKLPS